MRKKHGFDTRYINKKDLNKIRINGIMSYNREIELFLESKNGINWRDNFGNSKPLTKINKNVLF